MKILPLNLGERVTSAVTFSRMPRTPVEHITEKDGGAVHFQNRNIAYQKGEEYWTKKNYWFLLERWISWKLSGIIFPRIIGICISIINKTVNSCIL